MTKTIAKPELTIPTTALSVAEPWAWAITAGWKPVENRTWQLPRKAVERLPYPVAIHASTSGKYLTDDVDYWLQDLHPDILATLNGESEIFQPGCFVGSVEIVGCVEYHHRRVTFHSRIADELAARGYSPAETKAWFASFKTDPHAWASGPYCFLLANAKRLATPIKASGRLNFWNLTVEQAKVFAKPPRNADSCLPVGDRLSAE